MDAGHITRFARVDFRNDDRVFGIKDEDRFLHVYVIGKTGTGKSTLIETMALQDLERGNGFALIDPHGDLVARVAARIPTSHRDRVIYLDATDPTQPYGYNPLRHVSEDHLISDEFSKQSHPSRLQAAILRASVVNSMGVGPCREFFYRIRARTILRRSLSTTGCGKTVGMTFS